MLTDEGRSPARILEEWRAAERSLQDHEPGTAGYESGRADIDRLRDEYARAYKAQASP